MGKKTSLTSLHLGINKTTSFLSVETFPKDLRLSILHDILFITKLRIGWRPLKFWIKNKRFPNDFTKETTWKCLRNKKDST